MGLVGTKDKLSEAYKINLQVGETYKFKLGGLGSAGYVWEYTIEGSPGIVTASIESFNISPNLLPGGPPPDNYSADKTLIINALKSGETLIHMSLRRPWENKEPLKELYLKISVS